MNIAIYFAFLGVLGIWRLAELILSKRNARHHEADFQPQAEPAFRWMVFLHSSMYVLLPLEWWLRRTDVVGLWSMIAIAMTVVAVVLRVWTLWHIGKSWNVRIIGGQGYPICSSGPYTWIRHPNYMVVVLELLFIPLIANLWISALVLSLGNALVLFFRIREEEKLLRKNPVWVAEMEPKPRFVPFMF